MAIFVDAVFGGEIKRVEVSQAHGGGDSWQVMMDGYYCGRILNIDPLRHDINPKSDLCTEDINVIVELIKQEASNLG